MKTKRPPAWATARKFTEEMIKEHSEADKDKKLRLEDRIFGIELLAIKCGWTALSDDLEQWRNDIYNNLVKANS